MSIYFDNSATTLKKPTEVTQALSNALNQELLGNASRGAHDFSLNSYRKIEHVRQQVKDFLNASNYEVAFTHNATYALNMAIKGTLTKHDHVLTTDWEHNAVLRPLYQLEKDGLKLDIIKSSSQTGQLDYTLFEKKIQHNTKAFIINHSSNVTGNVCDLAFIKAFCRKYGLLLIVDASQTIGQLPIDLSDEQIDILCFTGHKSLYGPTGTGGMVIKKGTFLSPLVTGGDGVHAFEKLPVVALPERIEAGTINTLGLIGLGAGIDFINRVTTSSIQQHLAHLVARLTSGLTTLPNVTQYGDAQALKTGIVGFNLGKTEAAIVSDILWHDFKIATRSGFHCAPLMHETLKTTQQGIVRCSFSYFNTQEEVDDLLSVIQSLT